MTKHRIKFERPRKFEIFLLVLMILMLFWADVLQNKFTDFNLDYKVSVFKDLFGTSFQFKAITGFWIAILLYHILLATIIIRALFKRATSHIYDSVVGISALFGTMLILLGAIVSIYTDSIPFFSVQTSVINVYHLGIAVNLLSAIYYGVTD